MFISLSAMKISTCHQTHCSDAIVVSIAASGDSVTVQFNFGFSMFLLTRQCLFIHFLASV